MLGKANRFQNVNDDISNFREVNTHRLHFHDCHYPPAVLLCPTIGSERYLLAIAVIALTKSLRKRTFCSIALHHDT